MSSDLDYLKFKGVSNVQETLLNTQLENNLKSWYEWCFLGIGGFFNVSGASSGVFGGDFNKLRVANDRVYTSGQVWEGIRKDWVWETGVGFGSGQPISITGVEINGTGSGPTGVFPHYVNYPLGRIIFNTSISPTCEVRCNYSYRWVQVYKADDAQWWRELQYNSFKGNDAHITQLGSGIWAIGSNHRIQLPAIVVESIPQGESHGHQLGDGSLEFSQDVFFHVLAETSWARKQITDIIACQTDKNIWLYDTNRISKSGVYGLDYRGAKNTSGLVYPGLVDDYRWRKCRFLDARISTVDSPHVNLYESTVRVTCEVTIED